MHTDQRANKKIFFFLWLLCIIGTLSVLPYVLYLEIFPSSVSICKLSVLSVIQSAVVFGFICWLSSRIVPRTDLQPFLYDNLAKRIVYPALISGVFVSLVLFVFDQIFFGSSLLAVVHPPFWTGALASIYGAINEEVSLRLFLFTLIYYIFKQILRFSVNKRLIILWITNIIVALLFGLGHLPMAYKLISPQPFEVFRILFLNGVAGMVFGWLYWSRGLWAAIAAHFVADIMIHVLLI